MTLAELNTLLKSTGYDVAYNHFSKTPTIPFITYSVSVSERGSDEKNLIEVLDVRVELYTDKKDLAAESKVKDVLNFVEFDNDETYINDENLYLNAYEFSITQIKE